METLVSTDRPRNNPTTINILTKPGESYDQGLWKAMHTALETNYLDISEPDQQARKMLIRKIEEYKKATSPGFEPFKNMIITETGDSILVEYAFDRMHPSTIIFLRDIFSNVRRNLEHSLQINN